MARPRAKLLLDENIGSLVETSLHKAGFDVVSVLKVMRGAADKEVIGLALSEKRILITLDRDFGFLVHRESQKHEGVVYLRLKDDSPSNVIKVMKTFAHHLPALHGKFAKVTEDKIIIR